MSRLLILVTLALCACGLPLPAEPCSTCSPTLPSADELAMQQYERTATELLARRKHFASKQYSYPQAIGNAFFFYSFPGFDPVLHRADGATGARVDYGFSIGQGADGANYRASAQLVVTARRQGDSVRYTAYDATKANSEAGFVLVPAPTDEQRYWAYAVSGATVYIVTQKDGVHWLNRWTPGLAVEKWLSLEQATGTRLGVFLDFGVEGDAMLFIEGGRLWRLDLGSRIATWLQNRTEVSGTVRIDSDFVIWDAADGLYAFRPSTGQVLNISEQLKLSTYRLTPIHPRTHEFNQDFTRWKNWLIYGGGTGIFAYDLVRGEVKPVLLPVPNAEVRVTYRYPAALENGTLYVTGLESSSGSVGADGPLYSVDLNAVL